MAIERQVRSNVFTLEDSEPLSTLITIQKGHETTIAAGGDAESDEAARNALAVFGAWNDLDWDAAAEALDQIRHESSPTAPVDE